MYIKTQTNVYRTMYHFVFVTKYRAKVFTDSGKQNQIKYIMHHLAQNNEIEIIEIEAVEDHVHLVVSFPPKKSISQVVKSLKGGAARKWFKTYPETKTILWGGHLWTSSYFVSTVGDVSKEVILNYVKEQLTNYNSGRPRRDSAVH